MSMEEARKARYEKTKKQKQGESKENMIRECTEQTMLPDVENTSPLQQKSKETPIGFYGKHKRKGTFIIRF